jgi:hypothetical protein
LEQKRYDCHPNTKKKSTKRKSFPGCSTIPSQNKEGRDTDKGGGGGASNPGSPFQEEAGCLKKMGSAQWVLEESPVPRKSFKGLRETTESIIREEMCSIA